MSSSTMKAVTILAAAVAAPGEVVRLPLAAIKPDPAQPRKTLEGLEELAQSLKAVGQLEPVKVRPGEKEGEFIIIYGQRRYEAAKLAGLEGLDCLVDGSGMSEARRLEVQLVENALREGLKPVEESLAYLRLMQAKGLNGKQLAELLHISPAKVSRALALLKLPKEVQERIDAGQVAAAIGYDQASQKRSSSAQMRMQCKAAALSATLSVKPDAKPDEIVAALEAIAKAGRKALASGEVKCASDLAKFLKGK